MDTQVIVVGAGPVGLLLAGELRLGGAAVTVLERLATPSTESRASTLHARSMELLDQRGLLTGALPPCEPKGHFGGIPLDLTGVASPYAGLWKLPQPRLESILADWATGLGVVLLRRHDVTGLAGGPRGVRVTAECPSGEVTLTAGYLVGCDGEQSTVRRLAGIAFPGSAPTRELLRADVAGVDIPNRRFHRLPDGLAISSRGPNGITRVMMAAYGDPPNGHRTGEPGFDEICSVWQRLTGEDLRGGQPLWRNAFDNTSRQAARYRAGRVLLAGDAAHQSMPVGGQAINLGLQDAANLGWKLALAATGPGRQRLLNTYHAERHEAGRRTRSLIDAQAALLLGGSEVDGMRRVLAELIDHREARDVIANAIAGVDVRYPGTGGHALAGARIPHTELTVAGCRTTTTELLRAGRGLLLDLTADQTGQGAGEGWLAAAARWSGRVEPVLARPAPETLLRDVRALLLRPDGHAAHAGDPPADVTPALHQWFGPAKRAATRQRATAVRH